MILPIKYKLWNNKLWVRWGLEDIWKEAQWNVKGDTYTPISQSFGDNFIWTKSEPVGWKGRTFYGDILQGIKGHNGIDFIAPTGTRLYAPEDMEITELVNYDALGVKGTGTGKHRFFHLKEFHCSVGQKLKQGEFFALTNNTGQYTTAPHLHWDFKPLNPDENNGYQGAIDHRGFIEDLTIYKMNEVEGTLLQRTDTKNGGHGEVYRVENGDLVFYDSEKNPATRQIPLVNMILTMVREGNQIIYKSITEKEFNKFKNLIK